VDIDKETIARRIEEVVPGAQYKLNINKSQSRRVCIRVTDTAIKASVNPKRIRSERQLQETIELLTHELAITARITD